MGNITKGLCLIVMLSIVTACGGGGGGGGAGGSTNSNDVSNVNTGPLSAGVDKTVSVFDNVLLTGTGNYTSVRWEQTGGQTVELISAGLASTVEFIAPFSNNAITLSFEYAALGSNGSVVIQDTVNVVIQPRKQLKWGFVANGPLRSGVAVTADDEIIFGADWHGKVNGFLYALNRDGTVKWTNEMSTVEFEKPAIGLLGEIYAGANDTTGIDSGLDNDSVFAAYSPDDGHQIWNYQFSDNGYERTTTPTVAPDGSLYVGTVFWPLVYALNPDGTVQWTYDMAPQNYGYSRANHFKVVDDTLYASTQAGGIRAFNFDGSQKWVFAISGDGFTSLSFKYALTADEDGTLYVASSNNSIYVVHPDGSLKWSYETDSFATSKVELGQDGTVYVGNDNHLYALSAEGELKWKFTSTAYSGGSRISAITVDADGTIYAGGRDGVLYALNPDGTLKWSFNTNDWIRFLDIMEDSTLIMGTEAGILYAIDTSIEP